MSVEPWDGAPHPPRQWQAEALPLCLAAMRSRTRGLVYACTGAGKSVLLAEVCRMVTATMRPRWCVVVAVPTQALVAQLAGTLRARLGRGSVATYYGRRKSAAPASVVVACLPSVKRLREWLAAHGVRVAALIVDEAHRGEAYADDLDALSPATRLGVTATPYLADDGLAQWDRVIYAYRLSQAMRDGVLVPLRVVSGWGDGGDVHARSVEVCLQAGPYGIVDCYDIEDAEAHAAELTERGVPAAAVHSRMRTRQRDRVLRRHASGEIHALCQVDMLSEGVDLPYLRYLVMRRRFGSAVRRVQLVGRILRTCPGKTEATAYDLLGQMRAGSIDLPARLDAMEADADLEARGRTTLAERLEQEMEAAYPLARAREEVADWTMGVVAELRALGALPPVPDVPADGDGSGRLAPAGPGHVAELRRRSGQTRWLSRSLREGVRAVVEHPEDATVGAATDVLDLLRAVGTRASRQHAASGRWPRRPLLSLETEAPRGAVSRLSRSVTTGTSGDSG